MAEKIISFFFYISEKKFLWRVKTEADVFEGEKSHCPDQVRLSPLIQTQDRPRPHHASQGYHKLFTVLYLMIH